MVLQQQSTSVISRPEVGALEQEIAAKKARLAAVAQEVEQLQNQQSQRSQNLASQRASLEQLTKVHANLNEIKARRQEGTLVHASATKQAETAKGEVQKAMIALQEAEKRARTEEESDKRQLTTLQAESERTRAEVVQLEAKLASERISYETAYRKIGEQIYGELAQEYEALEQEVEVRLVAVKKARADALTFGKDALTQLGEWSDFQNLLRQRIAYSDPATIILEAAIELCDSVLAGGNQVKIPSVMISEVAPWRHTIEDLLSVSEMDWLAAFSNGQVQNLKERREALMKLLIKYRDSRRSALR